MRSQRLTSNQGFTIMEVALASTVLVLTLVGMMGAIESGSKMLDLSRKQTTAAQILRSEMDELRISPWATVSGYLSGHTNAQSSVTIDSNFSTPAQGFTCQRAVTQLQHDSGSNPTLVQVTFTVQWTGVTGKTYTRSSSTYVAKDGLSLTYQRS